MNTNEATPIHEITVQGNCGTVANGRRTWEARGPSAAGVMIQAFAAAGYDVVKTYRKANGDFTTNPSLGVTEITGSREVMLDGRQVAWIVFHADVPDYAVCNTYAC